jgi:hypothetical protein
MDSRGPGHAPVHTLTRQTHILGDMGVRATRKHTRDRRQPTVNCRTNMNVGYEDLRISGDFGHHH